MEKLRQLPLPIPETFDEIRARNLDKLYQRNPEWQALAGKENRMPPTADYVVAPEQQQFTMAVEERIIFQQ